MQRRNAFFLALSLFCFSSLSAIAQTASALTTTTAHDRRSVNVTVEPCASFDERNRLASSIAKTNFVCGSFLRSCATYQ